MLSDRFRRIAATYLAVFYLAVAAAPHHHLNGLEDLLLDQKSDSGVVKIDSPVPLAGSPAWSTFWFVRDDPCLACFNSDFVSAPSPSVCLTHRLERIGRYSAALIKLMPPAFSKETPSRAPPALG